MRSTRFRQSILLKGIWIATVVLIVPTVRGIAQGRDASSIATVALRTWIVEVGLSAVVALIVPILDPRDPGNRR